MTETRYGAFVQGDQPLVLYNLRKTVCGVFVLRRLQSLHSRLHHIHWRIEKNGCSGCNGTEGAYKKFGHRLVEIVAL